MPSHYDQYTEANPETGYEDVEKPRVPSYDLVDLMSLIGGSASPTQPSAVAQPTDILTEEQFNAGQDVFGNGVSPTGIQSTVPQDDAQGGPTLEEYLDSLLPLYDEEEGLAQPRPSAPPAPVVNNTPRKGPDATLPIATKEAQAERERTGERPKRFTARTPGRVVSEGRGLDISEGKGSKDNALMSLLLLLAGAIPIARSAQGMVKGVQSVASNVANRGVRAAQESARAAAAGGGRAQSLIGAAQPRLAAPSPYTVTPGARPISRPTTNPGRPITPGPARSGTTAQPSSSRVATMPGRTNLHGLDQRIVQQLLENMRKGGITP